MAGSERDQLVAERQLSGRSDVSPQASFAWLQELSAPDGLPSDLQDHIDGHRTLRRRFGVYVAASRHAEAADKILLDCGREGVPI